MLTIPGERHFEIVTDLWYIICIKTGMNIYEHLILYRDEARNCASEFIRSKDTLDYYSTHGWVSEENFFGFIARQELLESERIALFVRENPDRAVLIKNLTTYLSSPSENMVEGYRNQLEWWRRAREGNR
jgi:hypothetical protein